MKIYFAGSIHGELELAIRYNGIIEALANAGHRILGEHLGNVVLDSEGKQILQDIALQENPVDVYERNMQQLREANIVIVDLSIPSSTSGYIASHASLVLKKPVLCIAHIDSNASKVITGSPIKLLHYNSDEHAVMTVLASLQRYEGLNSEYVRAAEIAKSIIGSEGWYRGVPESVVNVIIKLREEGLSWDLIEQTLSTVALDVIHEYT